MSSNCGLRVIQINGGAAGAHTGITGIDLAPTGNPNEYTVVLNWTDENGAAQTTTDPSPITIAGVADNLFTADGTLAGPRIVDMDGNDITFQNGGDFIIDGKLTVTGLIDPTGLQFSGPQPDAGMPNETIFITDGSASGRSSGEIVFKDAGGTYHQLEGGGGNIIDSSLTQSADQTQDFAGFNQTWDNVGDITLNTDQDLASPGQFQVLGQLPLGGQTFDTQFAVGAVGVRATHNTGNPAQPWTAEFELSGNPVFGGDNDSRIEFGASGQAAHLGELGMRLVTPSVVDSGDPTGLVIRGVDATGEVEYSPVAIRSCLGAAQLDGDQIATGAAIVTPMFTFTPDIAQTVDIEFEADALIETVGTQAGFFRVLNGSSTSVLESWTGNPNGLEDPGNLRETYALAVNPGETYTVEHVQNAGTITNPRVRVSGAAALDAAGVLTPVECDVQFSVDPDTGGTAGVQSVTGNGVQVDQTDAANPIVQVPWAEVAMGGAAYDASAFAGVEQKQIIWNDSGAVQTVSGLDGPDLTLEPNEVLEVHLVDGAWYAMSPTDGTSGRLIQFGAGHGIDNEYPAGTSFGNQTVVFGTGNTVGDSPSSFVFGSGHDIVANTNGYNGSDYSGRNAVFGSGHQIAGYYNYHNAIFGQNNHLDQYNSTTLVTGNNIRSENGGRIAHSLITGDYVRIGTGAFVASSVVAGILHRFNTADQPADWSGNLGSAFVAGNNAQMRGNNNSNTVGQTVLAIGNAQLNGEPAGSATPQNAFHVTAGGFVTLHANDAGVLTDAARLNYVPDDGTIVYFNTVGGDITSVGFWGRENGAWVKL